MSIAGYKSYLFRLIVEESDKQVDGLKLLETRHILWTDGTLPDGSSGGSQQVLVLRLADECHQRVEAAIETDEIAGLLLFGALSADRTKKKIESNFFPVRKKLFHILINTLEVG